MKRIDTLIHPALWERARALFEALNLPVTVREVKTVGRKAPRREVYRGAAYYSNGTPQIEITALVAESELERALLGLEALAQDGEILVSAVEAHWVGRGSTCPTAAVQPATPSWVIASPLVNF